MHIVFVPWRCMTSFKKLREIRWMKPFGKWRQNPVLSSASPIHKVIRKLCCHIYCQIVRNCPCNIFRVRKKKKDRLESCIFMSSLLILSMCFSSKEQITSSEGLITISVITVTTNVFKMKCPFFWLSFFFDIRGEWQGEAVGGELRNWCCLGHWAFHGPEKLTVRWQNAPADPCHLHWNAMYSWGMLGRHLKSYFKRCLELWEDKEV